MFLVFLKIFLLAEFAVALTAALNYKAVQNLWCKSRRIGNDSYTTERCEVRGEYNLKLIGLRLLRRVTPDRCPGGNVRFTSVGKKAVIEVKNGCKGYFQVLVPADE